MKNTDRKELNAILEQVYSLHGKEVKPATVQLWYGILEPYDIAEVSRALSQVMRTSAYLPKPAEVIGILEPSQWPSPAEAWSTYPHDERDTGAVCDETQAAWSSAAELWESGDVIGARRAFEGAYQRHMDAAKAMGTRSPRWRLSVGWDAEKREQGAVQAVQRGLLPQSQVQRYISHDESQRLDDRRGTGELLPLGRFLDRPDGR